MVETRMDVGTTTALWRYPIKSLRGEALETTRVEAGGIPGDRASSLVIARGHARIGKPYRGKEDERLHRLRSGDEAVSAADERGVAIDVVAANGGHEYDAAPISILVDRWMEGLNAAVGYGVEYQRFRPNIFVAAHSQMDLDEPALAGRELRIGTVQLKVRSPIGRCVTTTYAQGPGASDPAILRYIASERGNAMGIYCDVLRAGAVRIGDVLVLEER
ncbi:MAG TPA: MOSC domain-containing protein [Candidatus Dormibacteraeota bacterium]|nr:MOSC domain-containing protein [Candidatus Dormibacteraeota bacterium]